MKNEKKKLAMLILGLKDKAKAESDIPPHVKGTGEESEDEEDEDMSGLQVAAEDMLEAIKNEDAKALVESLKAFLELCE